MKVASMQPYFFPFVGYFELIHEADIFVFLDDVNFKKRGFVNRNSLLLDGGAKRFSLPVSKMSQNRKINEHFYTGSYEGFLGLVKNAYADSSHFPRVYNLVSRICRDPEHNVAAKNISSVEATASFVGVEREFLQSSNLSISKSLSGQDRIIAICEKLGADTYVNPVGGAFLYDKARFRASGIDLEFFEPKLNCYHQGQDRFVSRLSIIDILMFCHPREVHSLISTDFSITK